jgi:hypothetical protein
MTRARVHASLVFLAALLVVAAVRAQLPADAAARPARIVAIGDVHGAYDDLVRLLQRAALIDADLDWDGADARLVVLGDVLDRGAKSRQALELLMRLREQAAPAGGEVQVLLGNHEVMNLVGDLDYTTPEELAAYRADERPEDREAAWSRFRAASPERPADALATEFARRYPPGFFGHRAAFSSSGSLGAWLLERPVLATIDRTAFVHGGLSAATTGRTAAEINREHAEALRDYLRALAVLTAAGALHPEDPFREHVTLAARFVASRASTASEPVRQAAERLRELASSPQLDGSAVFWYRGTAVCAAAAERGRVERELRALGVDRVVIGHTPTADARVSSRFDGAVVRADTGMLAERYGGRASAVVIRGNDVRVLYADANGETSPEPQRRVVGPALRGIGDDELETLLVEAPLAVRRRGADGTEIVELEHAGELVTAVFRPAPPRGTRSLPEVAAYRLDRLLELDLVPVAVRREVDGRWGSLQLPVDDLLTDQERTSQSAADAACPLRDQFNLMYVFDALAYNEGRSRQSVRYRRDGLQLVLTDNRRMFGTQSERPPYLRAQAIEIPEYLEARLASLTAEVLTERLRDVLTERQLAALLVRRDLLLQ